MGVMDLVGTLLLKPLMIVIDCIGIFIGLLLIAAPVCVQYAAVKLSPKWGVKKKGIVSNVDLFSTCSKVPLGKHVFSYSLPLLLHIPPVLVPMSRASNIKFNPIPQ
mmetsp:Transcript_25301/g.30920  ORF Transcript_25301/g.30920 Transcript_25301/m.30920 type:complete len:106 (-) Transcript_25301:879-1196(-)